MAYKIYLSPSDQIRNAYAVGNTNEAEQCRRIALAAVTELERCGFEVKTDTTHDGDDAMDIRITASNAWGADAHIPIHTNAYNGSVAGTRIFCYDTEGKGYQLSKAIMQTLSPITPGTSDSITAHHWAEVVYADAPTAYIEVGFHDNPTEAKWIIDHTEDIAVAICKGVCNHFGVEYIPEQQKLYRVQVGAFRKKSNAETYRDRLKADGYDAFIVEAEE